MWFRTDLRLADHPALRAAVESADEVVPLFVLDDHYWGKGAEIRLAYMVRMMQEFSDRIGGLHVVHGRPADEVLRVARAAGATQVHATEDFTPYGVDRDATTAKALAEHDIDLVHTGSAYAVSPGRITKDDGTPYKVFTPFFRAWGDHGWRDPAPAVRDVSWLRPEGRTHRIPDVAVPDGVTLPPIGEAAARRRWRDFLDEDVAGYDEQRDLPGADRTSRMSVHLKWGTIHPRTMLADLREHRAGGTAEGVDAYARELAFRDFYADVLHHRPDSATDYYDATFARMEYDEPGDGFEAWRSGHTGVPIVDAGMRQLLAEGWMHNRVRMIVASFLVKDLHVEWQHGADHFMDRLVDGDLASNQHGWQWVAGCGTDAAPYFRVFNPMTQGKKFDADGTYVRRWIPELRDVDAKHVHTPWEAPEPPADYPAPIVDHAEERKEALRRYQALRD